MWKHVSIWNHVKYLETHWIFPFLTDINQMKIMYMSEDVDVESTFVKNVGFGVRNPACSRSISAHILMSGLMYASYVTSPSKQKVRVWIFFFFLRRKTLFFLNGYSRFWIPFCICHWQFDGFFVKMWHSWNVFSFCKWSEDVWDSEAPFMTEVRAIDLGPG